MDSILTLILKYVKADTISRDDIVFGEGLDMTSIAFTEFVMSFEETYDVDIDIDDLDESIKTVGQLADRLQAYL